MAKRAESEQGARRRRRRGLLAGAVLALAGFVVLPASPASAAPPGNDNLANAIVIAGASGGTAGTNVDATGEGGETNNWPPINSVWYRWTAPATGMATFDTCGPLRDYDTTLTAYTGAAFPLALVTQNDDGGGDCGFGSRITFPAVGGTVYQIQVDGFVGATGNFPLNWVLAGPGPIAEIRTPANHAVYEVGQVVIADFSCAADNGSGVASCVGTVPDGSAVDTSVAGEDFRFEATVVDGTGQSFTAVHFYDVVPAPENPTCDGLAVTVDLGQGETPTEGDDVIRGTHGEDVIDGGGGNDTICGRGARDRIDGGAGRDRIFGGVGKDSLDSGGGGGLLAGNDGSDGLRGAAGSDNLRGGRGDDQLEGRAGNDNHDGGLGTDRCLGGPGIDTATACEATVDIP